MKAGIYARVSTEDQTIEQQLVELRAVAKARGYDVVEYVDHGLSGAFDESRRPGLKKLMADARNAKIKVVFFWDVSRMGRSVHVVVDIVERLRRFGTDFVTLRDNIDTTTPQGEFQFHVFAAMAQLMRKMISQNTRAKLALLKKKGVILGRPSVDRQKKRKSVQWDDVVQYKNLNPTASLRDMETKLGIGKSTISRMLSQKGPSKTAPIVIGERDEKVAVR